MARKISVIAREIRKDWQNVNFAAVPYLKVMDTLDSIEDSYLFDSGRDIVARFLSNASSWRGETARRVKTELKELLK